MADEPHLKTGGEPPEPQQRHSAERCDPACLEVHKQLKIRRAFRYLIFKIEGDTVHVEKKGQRSSSLADLRRDLPDNECRYAVYDHEYTTSDGRTPSKLFFLCWTPLSSPPYLKMAYSHGKVTLRELLGAGMFDVVAQAPEQLEDAFGIEVEEEEDESDTVL